MWSLLSIATNESPIVDFKACTKQQPLAIAPREFRA
jgi:hypothetical protein